MTDPFDSLHVFCGQLSAHRARLYVRLAPGSLLPRQRLEGRIRGPLCQLSHTLPAEIPLRFSGHAPTPLAESLIPDPVCWSPEVPAMYEVNCEIHEGSQCVAAAKRLTGLRGWSTRRQSFVERGQRRVIRAAGGELQRAIREAPLWRERRLTLLVKGTAPRELAQQCCDVGLPILPLCAGEPAVVAAEMTFWCQWAAVAAMVVDCERLPQAAWDEMPRDLILIQAIREQGEPAPWADALAVKAGRDDQFAGVSSRLKELSRWPLVARGAHAAENETSVESLRGSCEQLQQTLAPRALAGYVLG